MNDINKEETAKRRYRKSYLMKEKVLKALSKNPNVTLHEIADYLEVSKRTIIRYTNELKEEGFVSRVGSKKTGFWEVKGEA